MFRGDMQQETEFKYHPHGNPIPEGWEKTGTIETSHHGQHSVLIKRKSMANHERAVDGGTNEWLTPRYILDALGAFDLDPCSPINRPWPTAAKHFTREDNGLMQRWEGRVWLNPPYGNQTGKWLARLAEHGDGIALIFARTETQMFQKHAWPRANAMLFLAGRVPFCRPDGKQADNCGGAPSVLIAYGERNVAALEASGLDGYLVHLRDCIKPTCDKDRSIKQKPDCFIQDQPSRDSYDAK